jgi:hypothetical protein
MNDKKPPDKEISSITSDNVYYSIPDEISKSSSDPTFTPSVVADILGLTSQRIRQIADEHQIGERYGYNDRFLKFDLKDLMILYGFTRTAKTEQRNMGKVRRVYHKATDIRHAGTLEEFREVMGDVYNRMRQFVWDMHVVNMNRQTRYEERMDKRLFDLEEQVKHLKDISYSKTKEGKWGRGALVFGDAAPLTLNTHEAEAA